MQECIKSNVHIIYTFTKTNEEVSYPKSVQSHLSVLHSILLAIRRIFRLTLNMTSCRPSAKSCMRGFALLMSYCCIRLAFIINTLYFWPAVLVQAHPIYALHFALRHYVASVEVRSIVISVSVCLSVCPLAAQLGLQGGY